MRALHGNLLQREQERPAEFTITREGMLAVSRLLMNDPSTQTMAALIRDLAAIRR